MTLSSDRQRPRDSVQRGTRIRFRPRGLRPRNADPAAPLLRLLGLELVALEGVDPDRADSLAIVVLVLPRPHNAGSWHAVYVPEAPAVAMIEKQNPTRADRGVR